ncbi:UNVERIFIED_CONTAM: hypothetical protein K2H54_062383 [Gekko kuhli]
MKLNKYFKPKMSAAIHRCAFHQRSQKEDESVTDYIAALQEVTHDCKFPNLDSVLMDHLLCGLRDDSISHSIGSGTSTMKKVYQKTIPIACIYTKVPQSRLQSSLKFTTLGIDIIDVNHTSPSSVTDFVKELPDVFSSEFGCYNGPPVFLTVNSVVQPKCLKPQRAAFTIQPRIIEEFDKLLDNVTDFLLHLHSMPHSATEKSPAEYLRGFQSLQYTLQLSPGPVPCPGNLLSQCTISTQEMHPSEDLGLPPLAWEEDEPQDEPFSIRLAKPIPPLSFVTPAC